jgi:hypothetical protein
MDHPMAYSRERWMSIDSNILQPRAMPKGEWIAIRFSDPI